MEILRKDLLEFCDKTAPQTLFQGLNPVTLAEIVGCRNHYHRQHPEADWDIGPELFQDFLNVFYISFAFVGHEERRAMLAEEPPAMIDIRTFEIDPVRTAGNAAKVEYLHRRWNMGPPPEWVFKPEYFLSEPYYGWDCPEEKKKWQIENSNPEWAKRNILDAATKINPDDITTEPLFNPRLLIAHDPVYRAEILERECGGEIDHKAMREADERGDRVEGDRICQEGLMRRSLRHLAMIKGEIVYGPTPTLPPYIPRDSIQPVFYTLKR